jgi:hypothetical protein
MNQGEKERVIIVCQWCANSAEQSETEQYPVTILIELSSISTQLKRTRMHPAPLSESAR